MLLYNSISLFFLYQYHLSRLLANKSNDSNERIVANLYLFAKTLLREGPTVILTRRIRDEPVAGERRFWRCDSDGRNFDVPGILAGFRPAGTVRPQEGLQLIEKFEQHLRVAIFDIPRVIGVSRERQDVDPQVTA